MSNTEDNDWFAATSQSRSTESEAAAGEEPTLSVVPAAITDAGYDDDWFSAVGSVEATDPTAENIDEIGEPGAAVENSPLVQPAPMIGQRDTGGAAQAGQSKLRQYRGPLAVAGSAVIVVGIGAAAVSIIAGSVTDEIAPIAAEATPITADINPTPATSAEPTPIVEQPWCAGRTDGTPVLTDSADPGEAAIARFQEAYYVARDGVAARSVVATDARVADAESLNKGISEEIPVGTEHCVLAKRVADGVYAVDLFEQRPDTTTTHYLQTITTVTTPDGALITAITQRGG